MVARDSKSQAAMVKQPRDKTTTRTTTKRNGFSYIPSFLRTRWAPYFDQISFYLLYAWHCRRPKSLIPQPQADGIFPGQSVEELMQMKQQQELMQQQQQQQAEDNTTSTNNANNNGTNNTPMNDFVLHNVYLYTSSLSIDRVLLLYRTRVKGLTTEEMQERQTIFGLNELSTQFNSAHPIILYLHTLRSPFNMVLLAISLLIYVTGDVVGGSIILGMVMLSSILTFSQEYRSNKAIDKLRKFVTSTCQVSRIVDKHYPPQENADISIAVTHLNSHTSAPPPLQPTSSSSVIGAVSYHSSSPAAQGVSVSKALSFLSSTESPSPARSGHGENSGLLSDIRIHSNHNLAALSPFQIVRAFHEGLPFPNGAVETLAVTNPSGDHDGLAHNCLNNSSHIAVPALPTISEKQEEKKPNSSSSVDGAPSLCADDLTDTDDRVQIPTRELCVGDIVHLTAGSMIPADLRLLYANDLQVSQAALSGESFPVEKSAAVNSSSTASLFDCSNLCFMGTSVVSGVACGMVISVANSSYFGQIADKVTSVRERTAFDNGITRYVYLMLKFMFVMCGTVIMVSGLSTHDWWNAFLIGLSVAIGLCPEMLPMIITFNLAQGAQLMMKGGVIVKRLNAIQNLGAMDILCTDKTGTLTQDQVQLFAYPAIEASFFSTMSSDPETAKNSAANESDPDLRSIFTDPTASSSLPVLCLAYLNSALQTGLTNVMDAAVVKASDSIAAVNDAFVAVRSSYTKIVEVPFDFIRRRMSVIIQPILPNETQQHVRDQQQQQTSPHSTYPAPYHLMMCKGAVEEMLQVCSYACLPASTWNDMMNIGFSNFEPDKEAAHNNIDGNTECTLITLTDAHKDRVQSMADYWNEQCLRVLLLAYRQYAVKNVADYRYKAYHERELILCGFLCFVDPAKSATADALQSLATQGITVKVLTGDNLAVAKHVCRTVGLSCDHILTGKDISTMNDNQLSSSLAETQLFVKLTPTDKERLVRLLVAQDHIVGFLGDGINDAPALRASDVGISVDNAVDIAKEAADLILLQKDLGIIGKGVRKGRIVFGNIIKYIKMGASSNFGNMFSVLGLSIWLPFTPLTYLQILTNNLLYDFSQIGIPFDTVDEEYVAVPRRWQMGDIAKFVIIIGPISSIFDYCTWTVSMFVYNVNENLHDPYYQLLGQSIWFVESICTQTLIVHAIRTKHVPFIQSIAALPLLCTTSIIIALGIALPYIPFVQDNIPFTSILTNFYGYLVLFLFCYFVLTQIVKTWYYKTFGYK